MMANQGNCESNVANYQAQYYQWQAECAAIVVQCLVNNRKRKILAAIICATEEPDKKKKIWGLPILSTSAAAWILQCDFPNPLYDGSGIYKLFQNERRKILILIRFNWLRNNG